MEEDLKGERWGKTYQPKRIRGRDHESEKKRVSRGGKAGESSYTRRKGREVSTTFKLGGTSINRTTAGPEKKKKDHLPEGRG